MKRNRLINAFFRDYRKLHRLLEDNIVNMENSVQLASRVLNRIIIVIFIKENFVESKIDEVIFRKNETNIFYKLLNFFQNPNQFLKKARLEVQIITSLFKVNGTESSIHIPNEVMITIFNTLNKYKWSLLKSNDDGYITPDILGNVFEKYINQKENGAYYTDEDTISYINTNSIIYALFNKLDYKEEVLNGLIDIISRNLNNKVYVEEFHEIIRENYNLLNLIEEFILNSKDEKILFDIHRNLMEIKILDITAGTGAFLLGALDILMTLHKAINNKMNIIKDGEQVTDLDIVLFIIENNLYGLDIMNDAIEIAKFRMYLRIFSECIKNKVNLEQEVKLNLQVGNALTDNKSDFKIKNNILEGEYDCIIGNPPYVEYSKVRKQYEVNDFETIKCGNIYAYVIEKSIRILKDNGIIGVIVPISLVSTNRMAPLRRYIEGNCKVMFFSNFGDRPGTLFNGVHQKVTIFIGHKGKSYSPLIYTSKYYHWYNSEREMLFENIKYMKNPFRNKEFYYKIGNNLQKSIIEKVNAKEKSILDMTVKEGNYTVYLNTRLTFWVKCFIREKKSNEFKKYYFKSKEDALIFAALMNSNLYYFMWETISDGWHITRKELEFFKFDMELLNHEYRSKLIDLAFKLEEDLEKNKEYVGTKQTKYEYRHKKSKLIINEIDLLLKNHYGFTDEEYNHIINYNLKYRMNDELDEYLSKRERK